MRTAAQGKNQKMTTAEPRFVSLKTKITLVSLLIFVISLWGFQFFVSQTLRKDMTRLMGEQQFSTASILAVEVDRQIQMRVVALEHLAKSIAPPEINDPDQLQKRLLARSDALQLFNGGIFVTGPEGVVVASVPDSNVGKGTDFSQSDYVIAALNAGTTTAGKPAMGRVHQTPTFTFGTPIRGAQGQVVGVLAGVIELAGANFLDGLTGNRYGKSGGYFIVNPKHRMIVTGSDKKRSMEVLPAPGLSPWIDRFIEGYEGSAVTVNPLGVKVLVSIKRLPSVDWYVSVILPTNEAFAPFQDLEDRAFVAALLLTAIAGLLTWWMLARQLTPLLNAAREVSSYQENATPKLTFDVGRNDEIGQLLRGFNRLLDSLEQRDQAVRASEARFRGLSEMSSDYFWETDAQHRLTFHSGLKSSANAMTPTSSFVATMIGKPRWEAPFASPDAQGWQRHREMLDAHLPFRDFEVERIVEDGTLHATSIHGDPIFQADGSFAGYYGLGKDITQRRAMERTVNTLAFFDPLTGLPNRRLLDDRLQQALEACKRNDCYAALLFLDLDNFKPLNDTHGHAVGDLLLVQVTKRLKGVVRSVDTVARFGGDEFVVLLSALDTDLAESTAQTQRVSEKVRATLAEPFELEPTPAAQGAKLIRHHCTASIGVVVFGDEMDAIEALLDRADAAMYQAKRSGKNSVHFYATP